MTKTLILVVVLTITLTGARASDIVVCVHNRTGDASADWAQLGTPGTLVTSPFKAVAKAKGVVVRNMMGNFGPVPPFSGVGSISQEGNGFIGDFSIGDYLLLSNDNLNVQLQFFDKNGSPVGVTQVGAQIEGILASQGMSILALGQNGSSLGYCTVFAAKLGKEDNSAPYLGIADVFGPKIYSIVLGVYGESQGFAINKLSLTTNGNFTPDCVPPPSTTMVAWYAFDAAASVISEVDDYAMGNRGVPHGNPVAVPGMVSEALSFNGIDQYVEAPSTIATNFGPGNAATFCSSTTIPGNNSGDFSTCAGDFTIDTWIQVPSAAPTGEMTIVDKRSGSGSTVAGYRFFLSNGSLGLELADGRGSTKYLSPVLTPLLAGGGYRHVAVTVQRTSANGITWYDAGHCVQDSTGSCSTSDPTGRRGSLENNSPLRIGTTGSPLSNWLQADLDELEIYNRVLTQAEIDGIFLAYTGGKCKPEIQECGPSGCFSRKR